MACPQWAELISYFQFKNLYLNDVPLAIPQSGNTRAQMDVTCPKLFLSLLGQIPGKKQLKEGCLCLGLGVETLIRPGGEHMAAGV